MLGGVLRDRILPGAAEGKPDPAGERGGHQQAPAAGALGGDRLTVGCLRDRPPWVAVADHDLDPAARQPAGHLDRRARVHHGVGTSGPTRPS